MGIERILSPFIQLGQYIGSAPSELKEIQRLSFQKNQWFTIENTSKALHAIQEQYLYKESLEKWLAPYAGRTTSSKRIGIVAAGNIPFVAFHDILCVLVCGHQLELKLSDKDNVLTRHLIKKLIEFEPSLKNRIHIVERLTQFDAVIATGNNNSSRYFEYYFRNVPNIIRKNRNSIAILTGKESFEELELLADDVFQFFGLGCRNVSKLYAPADYDFTALVKAFQSYSDLMNHNKYRNNLDYNRTLLLMNIIPYLNCDHINLVKNQSVSSPIASLHFEYYENLESVFEKCRSEADLLQCIVGNSSLFEEHLINKSSETANNKLDIIDFGKSQQPQLWDYADNENILEFLFNC